MSHDPQDAHRTSYFLSPERLYLLLFALTVLCISLLLPVRSVRAKSLTGFCSNPFVVNGYAHCYAERTWTGYTGGAYVLINPTGALKCIGCANNATTPGFIDNEMWFTGDNGHWVEVGISTWPANDPNSCNAGHDSTCGFWA